MSARILPFTRNAPPARQAYVRLPARAALLASDALVSVGELRDLLAGAPGLPKRTRARMRALAARVEQRLDDALMGMERLP